MKSPKLSIIVPVYNAEKNLKRCLDSISNQTMPDWECFLVDDGSSDRSGSICDAYTVQDNRFKVIHKYNAGPAAARNLGLFLSRGDWIGFVDSDDWIEPDRFETAIMYGESSKIPVVQCSINVWSNNKITKVWHLGEPGVYSVRDGRIFSDPLYDIGHCWDKVYSAKLIKDNDIWFPECDLCEDTLFNARVYFCGGRILSISDILYNYTISNGSLAHSKIDGARKTNLLNSFEQSLATMENDKYFEKDIIRTFLDQAINNKCKDLIDYVFPYVDNSKEQWRNEYNLYTKGSKLSNEVNGDSRFRSGESLLKFKFRAIEKYMPWVGTIHMIVSDITQVPDWIDTEKIHIVLHKDIIPKEHLPTFNSCTIEMFIHNIFGLSEKFIYSNDDVYPNNILKPKFYFEDNDKLKSDFHIRRLWHDGDINQVWAKIPINSIKLVAQDTPEYMKKYVDGVHLYELQHIGRPMFRSVNYNVFKIYKEEIINSISRFREVKNFNQTIFTAYALFHNRGLFETFRHSYYQIKGKDTESICNTILDTSNESRPRAICCNDGDNTTNSDFILIENAFSQVYPKKSKYEL